MVLHGCYLTSTDEAPCHSKLRPRHRLGDRHFVRFVLGPGGPLRFLRCGFWDAMGDAQDLGWTSKKSVQNGYLWLCTMNGAIYGYHWISRLYIYMYTYNIIGYLLHWHPLAMGSQLELRMAISPRELRRHGCDQRTEHVEDHPRFWTEIYRT